MVTIWYHTLSPVMLMTFIIGLKAVKWPFTAVGHHSNVANRRIRMCFLLRLRTIYLAGIIMLIHIKK